MQSPLETESDEDVESGQESPSPQPLSNSNFKKSNMLNSPSDYLDDFEFDADNSF